MKRLAAAPHPCCLLFEGRGGVGKSAAAKALSHDLGDCPFSALVEHSASNLSIHQVRRLFSQTFRLRPMPVGSILAQETPISVGLSSWLWRWMAQSTARTIPVAIRSLRRAPAPLPSLSAARASKTNPLSVLLVRSEPPSPIRRGL